MRNMSKETLLKEKEALEEWLRKIKENNNEDEMDYWMLEIINEQIMKINEELKKYIN